MRDVLRGALALLAIEMLLASAYFHACVVVGRSLYGF